jgi:phosphoglycolate phosphatase
LSLSPEQPQTVPLVKTPAYRHIIWDWNGTLLDDLDYSIAVMNGLLWRRGLPLLDRSRYHAHFDFPVRNYYAQLGFDPAQDSFESLSAEFISNYDAQRLDCALHRDARRLLSALTAAGLTQSILSAYRQTTLEEIVAHFELTHHFTDLAGLDNIYAGSKAKLGQAQVIKLGLPPTEILLIGDTIHDLEVAREIGVDCVLVAAGHHPSEKLHHHHHRVLASLAELPTIPGLFLPQA